MLRRDVPLYAALTLLFCWPIFQSPMGTGILDWDQHFFLYAAVAKSVFAFHQAPFWNPWYCGGSPLWSNPEVAVLSPAYLLALAMPLQVALKINIALHFFVALMGMNVLLRRTFHVSSTALVIFLSSVYACCGGLAFHIAVGHMTFLNFCYLPFLMHFAIQAADRPSARPIVAGGVVIALSIYNGGIYAIVMVGTGLGVFAALTSIVRRDWRPFAAVALIGLAGLAFGAPKVVPIVAMLRNPLMIDSRSAMKASDFMTWGQLKTTLVDPARPANWPAYFEYGNYIGLASALLIVAAVLYWLSLRPTKERSLGWALAIVTALLLLLTRGTFSDYAPYTLMRHLPIYSGLRSPARYSIIFVLFGVSTAAVAVHMAFAATEKGVVAGFRRLGLIVLVLATVDIVWHNSELFRGAMSQPPFNVRVDLTTRTPAPRLDMTTYGGDNAAMMNGIQQNVDIVNCYRLFAPETKVQPDRDIVEADGTVTISNVSYSPNRIDVDAAAADPGRLYLNQNYITGWHASEGTFGVNRLTGLATTTLPVGFKGTVSFYYRPPGLIAGGIILLLAAAVAMRYVVR